VLRAETVIASRHGFSWYALGWVAGSEFMGSGARLSWLILVDAGFPPAVERA
jgi:hypothetical protein